MSISQPVIKRAILLGLAYLWTAAAALAVSYSAGWEYDGDLGWWVVTVYSFPALTLTIPVNWLAGKPYPDTTYCLIALIALTFSAIIFLRRAAKASNVH